MRPEVVRRALPWRDPEAVVAALAATGDVVWTDAGVDAAAGRSLVLWGPAATASAHDGDLGALWALVRDDLDEPRPGTDPLGWAGWLGYGFGTWLLDRDGTVGPGRGSPPPLGATGAPDASAPPDLALLRADRALAFDHGRGTVEAVALGHDDWPAEVAAAWDSIEPLDPPGPPEAPPGPDAVHRRHSDAEYLALVERCRAAIAAGDAYVLCLTTSVRVDAPVDAFVAYRRLRRASPAPHASFVRIGGTAVVGASPESFLEVGADGRVSSSPIKGTRPRAADPAVDARLARELGESEKERAENVMIVDLVRNDLARVSEVGSVVVTELLEVHGYRQVHQLVSTVEARLAPGLRAVYAVEAAFPAGSMTGAPKRAAVGLLERWEGAPRGVYSGAVGRLGLDGSASLAMAIRSVVVHDVGLDGIGSSATVGVGGGVTSSSVPRDELAEAGWKAAALLRVLGASPGRASW